MIANPDAHESQVRIGDELKTFIEGGVSVVVGTRDEVLVPEVVRAWGPHVSEDRHSVSVCVPQATSARTQENLAGNGLIAVAFSLPSTYQTVQLKGRYAGTTDATADDLLITDRHREAFARVNEGLGIPRSQIEAFWNRELVGSPLLVTIRFVVHQIFNQTPGPYAGLPL